MEEEDRKRVNFMVSGNGRGNWCRLDQSLASELMLFQSCDGQMHFPASKCLAGAGVSKEEADSQEKLLSSLGVIQPHNRSIVQSMLFEYQDTIIYVRITSFICFHVCLNRLSACTMVPS